MIEWIASLTEVLGYFGLALLGWAARILPPLPPELVFPFAGFQASQGRLALSGVVLAGAVGQIAGVLCWYAAARAYGHDRFRRFVERHGRWLTLSTADLDRAMGWFGRHGRKAVFLCQFVPAVRTLIAVPAGVWGMGMPAFLALTSIGTTAWTFGLAWAGYLLAENWQQVGRWVSPVGTAVGALVVMLYAFRFIRHWRNQTG